MERTTAASLAARLGVQGYNYRHSVQKYWTQLKAYLDKGATQIVITGHAGAGKTILAAQMHGAARELGFEIPGESRTVEVSAVTAGAWTKLVRVLPGQEGFRTAGAVEACQGNAELEGVIHVVDFGYVAPRDSVAINDLIKAGGFDTIAKLREQNLRTELEDLRVILSDVRRLHGTTSRPKWLAIVINKVDLFANERDAALGYYHPEGSGAFGRALAKFQRDVGQQNVSIYLLQSCALEKDFAWNGEIARSGLERQEQTAILREFMKSIAAISEFHT
jgi:hypothetical protein